MNRNEHVCRNLGMVLLFGTAFVGFLIQLSGGFVSAEPPQAIHWSTLLPMLAMFTAGLGCFTFRRGSQNDAG